MRSFESKLRWATKILFVVQGLFVIVAIVTQYCFDLGVVGKKNCAIYEVLIYEVLFARYTAPGAWLGVALITFGLWRVSAFAKLILIETFLHLTILYIFTFGFQGIGGWFMPHEYGSEPPFWLWAPPMLGTSINVLIMSFAKGPGHRTA